MDAADRERLRKNTVHMTVLVVMPRPLVHPVAGVRVRVQMRRTAVVLVHMEVDTLASQPP
jgi:hypothetical protein